MNRKQRRAEKKKNHEPTLMVKRSDLRAYVDSMVKSDEVQKAILEEAKRVNLEVAVQQDIDILTLILMSLRRREKWGRTKLLRFCYYFNELQKYYAGFYEDCDMFAMRYDLKREVGIDVEKINDEIERFLNENPNERET